MPRIFISYRRDDSQAIADRIYEHLSSALPPDSVFKDVDNIPPGTDFRTVIRDAVRRSDVMLVLIGREWATVRGADALPRLHNPGDFVRLEIENGLQTTRVTVIPVLVNNAQLPPVNLLPPSLHDLVYRNAMQVRNDPDFVHDIERLIRLLTGSEVAAHVGRAPRPARDAQGVSPVWLRRWMVRVLIGGLALVVLACLGMALLLGRSERSLAECDSGTGWLAFSNNQTWALDYEAAGAQREGIAPVRRGPSNWFSAEVDDIFDLDSAYEVSIYSPDDALLAQYWSDDVNSVEELPGIELGQSGEYAIHVRAEGLTRWLPYSISLGGSCN